jgi:hypothetical protein
VTTSPVWDFCSSFRQCSEHHQSGILLLANNSSPTTLGLATDRPYMDLLPTCLHFGCSFASLPSPPTAVFLALSRLGLTTQYDATGAARRSITPLHSTLLVVPSSESRRRPLHSYTPTLLHSYTPTLLHSYTPTLLDLLALVRADLRMRIST